MSEPIQSISQGNYILHNIDAKKLYVQEPLFTANSGDAVYVGWRPDETVLYSGAMASSVNLSEPLSSFDRVKIYYASDFTEKTNEHIVADIDATNGSHFWTPVAGLGLQNAWISMNLFSASNDYTVLTCPNSKLINFGKYNVTGTALAGSTTGVNQSIIYKVVGVNRKENA